MFSLLRPTPARIAARAAVADEFGQCTSRFLAVADGTRIAQFPPLFSHDYSQSRIGEGAAAFEAAKAAFARWEMFDLDWVRVVNPQARIEPGAVVGVEAHTLGLWSLNFSRILQVVDTAACFGFLYATTQFHVEEGEERFLLEFDRASGTVVYTLEAVSRPRSALARLGFPVTRAFQRRFARDSHRRMKAAAMLPGRQHGNGIQT